MDTTYIFIGDKQIGVNCLRQLLKRNVVPSLVIGNSDDDGQDKSWHESLIKIAKQENLPYVLGKKVKDSSVVDKIKEIKPGIIFCIGRTQIIPKEVLENSGLGCLNIHPALLPKYRGRYSTVHAIFNGEKHTGVTMHWMDEGMDSGPIIMQEKMQIREDDTAKSLYERFTTVGEKLFVKFLDMWLSGKEIKSVPQDESKATYCRKEMPNNGQIDWSWSGEKIRNFIRAMTFEPFPPASFNISKKKMVIVDEKYFKGFE